MRSSLTRGYRAVDPEPSATAEEEGVAVSEIRRDREVVCDADNGGLTLPPGFCELVVADNVGRAACSWCAEAGTSTSRSTPTAKAPTPGDCSRCATATATAASTW